MAEDVAHAAQSGERNRGVLCSLVGKNSNDAWSLSKSSLE